ncbi:unnamed protein product [Dicrocoelium dendriticum]|nr:unnamed protein product [Dicrocoelium dendriticum]
MEDLPPSLQLTHGVIGYHDFPIPSTNHMDYADVGVWIDTSVPPPHIVKPCISSALKRILHIDGNNRNPLTPINALRNQQPISDMMQRTQPNSPAPTGYCRMHGLFPSKHFPEGHTQFQPHPLWPPPNHFPPLEIRALFQQFLTWVQAHGLKPSVYNTTLRIFFISHIHLSIFDKHSLSLL